MPRPSEVSVSTYVMAIFNFLHLFTEHWGLIPFAKLLFGVFLFVVLSGYLVLYFFWKGQNWARWTVQGASVLVIVGNFAEIAHPSLPGWDTAIRGPLYYAEALFAPFLLYYLNTSGARGWFYRHRLGNAVEGE